MALQAAPMFCCGCPLTLGVPIILGFHFLACILYIAAAFSSIVLHASSFESTWSLPSQMWMAGFYFSGIPIIMSALYGVIKRIDLNVMIYLIYLTLSFVIDTVALIYMFIWEDACKTTSSFISVLGEDFGTAFVCGLTRISSWIFVVACISIEVYCLYIVWSFCEDVRSGASAPGLLDLVTGKEDMFMKKHSRGQKSLESNDIVGLAHHKLSGPYPSPYGALQDCTYPTHNIFGGNDHDMNYIPGLRKSV